MKALTVFIIIGILLSGWIIIGKLLLFHFDRKKRNAILEVSFYLLLCLLSIITLSREFYLLGEIGTTQTGIFTGIFMISFFIFESFLKFNNRFTLIHHIALSIVAFIIIFSNYLLGAMSLLLLYELPGIVDVININFLDKDSKYKEKAYIIAIFVRILSTALIGPIVLGTALYVLLKNQGGCWLCTLNLIIVILSITLNLIYTINSLRVQKRKLHLILDKIDLE